MEITDLEHAAAVLAAAFVAHGIIKTPEQAATRYFDCLAALTEARKGRVATGHPRG